VRPKAPDNQPVRDEQLSRITSRNVTEQSSYNVRDDDSKSRIHALYNEF
jgi:hypothetical protein